MKLQIPDSDVHAVADWAELFVLSTGASLSKLELVNFIKTNLPEVKEEDGSRTALADSTFGELSFRSSTLYGTASHYEVTGDTINPLMKLEDLPEAALCLIFSLKGVVVQKGRNNGTKYFEKISNIASKTLLGESYLVGFPNNRNLISQIGQVCAQSFEPKGHENPKGSDKDGGVDIIAWKAFDDKRANKVVILVQSGAGKHFNQKKPINIEKWRRWVHWAYQPLTAMTTPRMIRDPDEWQDLSDYYKLIIDRPRLIKFIHGSPHADAALKKEIEEWCKRNTN